MPARLLTVLLGVALLAAGCTTAQPSAFIPPPIPTHPKLAREAVPPPAVPAKETPTAMRTPATFTALTATTRDYSRLTWANRQPIDSRMVAMGKPVRITVHHEGDTADLSNRSLVVLQLQKIEKVHEKPQSQGGMEAGCIGYHFLIDPNGNVWEGRPLAYQGAHAGNNDANRGNIGICLLGDFDVQRPTAAQKESLRRLLCKLMNQYDIPVSRVYTHKEIKEKFGLRATDCPGKNLQPYVDGLRRDFRTAKR